MQKDWNALDNNSYWRSKFCGTFTRFLKQQQQWASTTTFTAWKEIPRLSRKETEKFVNTITFPCTLRVAMMSAILWVLWDTEVAMAACGLLATDFHELTLSLVMRDNCIEAWFEDEENAKLKVLFEVLFEVTDARGETEGAVNTRVETGVTAIAIAPLVPVFLPPFSFQQPALFSANPQQGRCQATQNPALSLRRQPGGSKKPRATFHNKKSQKQRLNPLPLLSHHTTIPFTLQPPGT